ncbi:MAG: hypothetical protein AAFX50_05655 [Acidobacteriota bacterium]
MSSLELAAVIVGKGSLWLLGALAVYTLAGARTSAAHRHLWLAAALAGVLVLPMARAVLPPLALAWLPAAETPRPDGSHAAFGRALGQRSPATAAASGADRSAPRLGAEPPGPGLFPAGGRAEAIRSAGLWLAWLWLGTTGLLLATARPSEWPRPALRRGKDRGPEALRQDEART